jgi:hypothetical protein
MSSETKKKSKSSSSTKDTKGTTKIKSKSPTKVTKIKATSASAEPSLAKEATNVKEVVNGNENLDFKAGVLFNRYMSSIGYYVL